MYYNNSGVIILSKNQTEHMDAGDYKIAVQTVGQNKIKEVSYIEYYNNTSLIKNEYLTSPFKKTPDVQINGLQPNMVLDKLKLLINGTYDDKLTIYDLTVEQPIVSILGLDQIDDNTTEIYGTSNLNIGTNLTILWDSDKLVSAQDYRQNTFRSIITDGKNGTHRWSTIMHLYNSIQDLSVGKHWVDVITNNKTTRVGFSVLELYKNQTPPPMARIKYMYDGVVVTPTPIIVEKQVPYEVTVVKTVVIPTQPFPKNALGEEYNPSELPDLTKYVYILLGICAVLCVIGGVLWRRDIG
jgi:hypothetical protein